MEPPSLEPPSLSAIVLAAGEGTRMRSTRPKPLHLLCGRAMVLYVLDALAGLHLERCVVVVGRGADLVTKRVTEAATRLPIEFVEQSAQRGTGDAVAVALTAFPPDDDPEDGTDVLVLPGDTPLLRPSTVAGLVATHRRSGASATILSAVVDDPTGYGRVVRHPDGRVARIVEHRDATPEELAIDEINTSIYCFRTGLLVPALRRVSPDNAQGELYLTDVIQVLALAGHPVAATPVVDPVEVHGVNDRRQLAVAEASLRRRTNDAWLQAGVTMVDPERTYIDAGVRLAADVTLFPGVHLTGTTTVGEGTEVGPGCRLADCTVGVRVVLDHVVADHAEIGDGASVGPFALLGPGTRVLPGARTGPHYTGS